MLTVKTAILSTKLLKDFSVELKKNGKFLDGYFVDSLISSIDSRKGVDKSCVDKWLRVSFDAPKNFDEWNCADNYNFLFYQSIMENIKKKG